MYIYSIYSFAPGIKYIYPKKAHNFATSCGDPFSFNVFFCVFASHFLIFIVLLLRISDLQVGHLLCFRWHWLAFQEAANPRSSRCFNVFMILRWDGKRPVVSEWSCKDGGVRSYGGILGIPLGLL